MKNYLIAIFIILFNNALWAQISPGELHQSHAKLEGLENCTKCHVIRKKVSARKCLQCHTILSDRIQSGRGLHANPDYQKCVNCHVEHQGREFDLIYWKKGKENFNHSLAGYPLIGKHAGLKCENCHRPEFIPNKKVLILKGKDLNRTFLGLTQDCLSCHHDEHRGQIHKPCLNCHSIDGWKPAPNFNHNKTGYPLTGKHVKVACQKCHRTIMDHKFKSDPDFMQFTGLRFRNCVNCHRDVHQNRFGQNCETCHNTTGWQHVNRAQFDHDKTKYPLQGKHATVTCDQCHLPGKPLKKVKFKKCTDCHQDYHQGQLVHRRQKGACEECHSVFGFSPANFTIKQHNLTEYPLKGSHLAVPCLSCHVKINRNTRQETIQFRFRSTTCLACHKDPHQGEVDKYSSSNGCEFCHSVESWRSVKFDHNQTAFRLEGRHQHVQCGDCHKAINAGTLTEYLQFKDVTKRCQGCHKDVHQGQFRDAKIFTLTRKNFTYCERCHTPGDWLAEKFDHNRDSKFKLEGAHENVACDKCHKTIKKNGLKIVRYKPLNPACKGCHGSKKNKKI